MKYPSLVFSRADLTEGENVPSPLPTSPSQMKLIIKQKRRRFIRALRGNIVFCSPRRPTPAYGGPDIVAEMRNVHDDRSDGPPYKTRRPYFTAKVPHGPCVSDVATGRFRRRTDKTNTPVYYIVQV